MRAIRLILSGFFFCASFSAPAGGAEIDLVHSPVPVVLEDRLRIQTPAGTGEVPIRVSRDWGAPQPDVRRVVIIIHGWPRRDLDADRDLQQHAAALAADTLFVTPQFLTAADVQQHQLSAMTLRWRESDWLQGYSASAPASISAFAVIDEILTRLADRGRFPRLDNVVLAGHSAGGQLVQRYAVVGRGEPALSAAGIHLRYVVANPAAYLYFDERRPLADGSFADVSAACPAADSWNNGFSSRVPSYVRRPLAPAALASDYLRRDVVYLLGTADNDPSADALGQSCTYKSQGASRLERGHAYFRYVTAAARDGHLPQRHRLLEVAGVAHHPFAMYHSPCGLAALFDQAACAEAPSPALHAAIAQE